MYFLYTIIYILGKTKHAYKATKPFRLCVDFCQAVCSEEWVTNERNPSGSVMRWDTFCWFSLVRLPNVSLHINTKVFWLMHEDSLPGLMRMKMMWIIWYVFCNDQIPNHFNTCGKYCAELNSASFHLHYREYLRRRSVHPSSSAPETCRIHSKVQSGDSKWLHILLRNFYSCFFFNVSTVCKLGFPPLCMPYSMKYEPRGKAFSPC